MNIGTFSRVWICRLRLHLSVKRLVVTVPFLFLCISVAQGQDPKLIPVLQGLLHKYRGCILERYETQADMVSRRLDPRLSGLTSTTGLQARDLGVLCAAGNVCTLTSRQATYAVLEAQANRGDPTNFETNLKLAIPQDCIQCQKHQEWHTKHVHCTMDCGGNNGLTKGPCFEGCKAGVGSMMKEIDNDIRGALQAIARTGADPPGSSYTSHQLPFDLVWDLKTGIDANSLPLNPLWGYQLDNKGQVPDFGKICGPAFLDHERTLDTAILATTCTSQPTSLDLPKLDVPCAVSNKKVLAGHLNWAIATEVGSIHWSEDSLDGDFNFELMRPDNAAQTTLNAAPEYGLHLEFKESETIRNFKSPFWVNFYKGIESPSFSEKSAVMASIEGNTAVVTGLLGIDGVHGGYTESHPVYSLAIQTAQQDVPGGMDVSWAFFLRNSGGEGCCSSHKHYWYGLNQGDPPGTHWYFIQLPSPPGAAGINVQPAVTQVWANQSGIVGPVISQDSQWTYLAFRLPDPMSEPELDGEISLHYVVLGHTLSPPKQRPSISALKSQIPRGDEWEDVRKRMRNPVDQKRLDETLRASQLAEKSRPHTFRLAAAAPASIPPHQPLSGPGHKGVLTSPTAVPDPSGDASRELLDENVRKIVPKEILPPKRSF